MQKGTLMQKLFLLCERNRRGITALFFIIFLFAGLAVYKDYGISCDETRDRYVGLFSFNYIFHGDRHLFKFIDRDYGVAFQLPLVIAEKALGLKDMRDVFFMRHLLTFLAFYSSVIIFYFLCKKIFNNWKYGLVGSLFLVLSPRIFADSFYNSKDLVFLSAFIGGIYTLVLLLDKKKFLYAVIHGIVSAIVINIRILGVLIPFFTVCAFLVDTAASKKSVSVKPRTLFSIIFSYICICVVCTVLFWPWLWEDPLHRFIQAFANMSKFRWDGPVLYLGQYIPASKLPWHYMPVWMLVTTPLAYTFLFFIGLPSFFIPHTLTTWCNFA